MRKAILATSGLFLAALAAGAVAYCDDFGWRLGWMAVGLGALSVMLFASPNKADPQKLVPVVTSVDVCGREVVLRAHGMCPEFHVDLHLSQNLTATTALRLSECYRRLEDERLAWKRAVSPVEARQ